MVEQVSRHAAPLSAQVRQLKHGWRVRLQHMDARGFEFLTRPAHRPAELTLGSLTSRYGELVCESGFAYGLDTGDFASPIAFGFVDTRSCEWDLLAGKLWSLAGTQGSELSGSLLVSDGQSQAWWPWPAAGSSAKQLQDSLTPVAPPRPLSSSLEIAARPFLDAGWSIDMVACLNELAVETATEWGYARLAQRIVHSSMMLPPWERTQAVCTGQFIILPSEDLSLWGADLDPDAFVMRLRKGPVGRERFLLQPAVFMRENSRISPGDWDAYVQLRREGFSSSLAADVLAQS